jgi:hypothetical protein
LRSVAAVLPDRRLGLDALSTAIVARWDQIDRLAPLLQHGDLSPDQVLVTGDGAVLVDLDNCGVFPRGWDQATWRAAQLADGVARPVALPGPEPDPALLAVAVAVRSPEPFVRQRPDWPVLIDRLAAAGLTAVAADARSACR